MKNIITLAVSLFSLTIFAQVGINNNTPKATLDITAQTTNGSKPEGLLPPRLTGDQIQAGDAQYTAAQAGIIIYATAAATAPSTKTANITAAGYYFYDGSAWQKLTGATGDTTNDAWVNDTGNTMVKVGTKADGTARAAGTDVVVKDNGAVGIGTTTPNASAALDISSTNKGMLIPRVALTSTTDATTIPSPITGLMIYNTGAGALTYKGFVFWSGTEWRQIDNSPIINPSITSLDCSNRTVFPISFTSGSPYSGTLTIPYTGGNGGSYTSGTSFTQNGLTFLLNPGTLNYGNGSITYSVSGTPNFTSPSTISVPLTFLGNSCNCTIGNDFSVRTISYARNVISPINASTPTNSITTLGSISVRLNATASSAVGQIFQFRLNGFTDNVTIWNEWSGSGSNGFFEDYNNWNQVKPLAADTWQNTGGTVNIPFNDTYRFMISLFNKKEVYRVSVVMNTDVAGAVPSTNGVTIFVEALN